MTEALVSCVGWAWVRWSSSQPHKSPGVFVTPLPGPQSSGVMIQILCGSVLVGFCRKEVYSRDWPASYGG